MSEKTTPPSVQVPKKIVVRNKTNTQVYLSGLEGSVSIMPNTTTTINGKFINLVKNNRSLQLLSK